MNDVTLTRADVKRAVNGLGLGFPCMVRTLKDGFTGAPYFQIALLSDAPLCHTSSTHPGERGWWGGYPDNVESVKLAAALARLEDAYPGAWVTWYGTGAK